MTKEQHAKVQKWLLITTGVLVAAFVFTFPTRDRRATIDRIRMKVGAEHLVSKQTLKEIAAKEKVARNSSRKPSSIAPARGAGFTRKQKEEAFRSVNRHCNDSFNRSACAQWLNYCGSSCKILVKKELWNKLAASPAQARNDVKRRGR